ncbi:DprA-like DNA recombination-mediator protein [Pseudomonas phage Psa21]|uniref:Uncharacterized protein n=1 Tax=Pseudomonas phage Psa21 TaxID=2530023 RepID=A0A481W4S2_9CAUD|nr:DprA-like DNA recombination-mediator protein [Pseudomonas phage Psa21]QBJ02806.1 hypothetical protein PSA21_280 [Pseudomonas phage Psa21]
MHLGVVAGVGSRTVPEWALELMIRLGRTYTDLGYQMSSGDAWDSDRAFLYGAAQSKRYQEIGAKVYLHKDGTNGRWIKDNPFYYDASLFDTTVATTARSMAILARGSTWGLNETGLALHTRNVYQIHGINLDELVKAIYFYAEPLGKTKVSGGTNTALQLAVKAGVPIVKNLYYQETVDEITKWLEENELDYPYIDIDWHQIHKPNDPRLQEFEE